MNMLIPFPSLKQPPSGAQGAEKKRRRARPGEIHQTQHSRESSGAGGWRRRKSTPCVQKHRKRRAKPPSRTEGSLVSIRLQEMTRGSPFIGVPPAAAPASSSPAPAGAQPGDQTRTQEDAATRALSAHLQWGLTGLRAAERGARLHAADSSG